MSRIEDGGAVEAGLVVERFELDWGDDLGGKGKMIPDTHGDWVPFESWTEAAAEIIRLRAENAGMREALKRFGALAENYEDNSPSDWVGYRGVVYVSDLRLARAALSKASQAEGGEK